MTQPTCAQRSVKVVRSRSPLALGSPMCAHAPTPQANLRARPRATPCAALTPPAHCPESVRKRSLTMRRKRRPEPGGQPPGGHAAGAPPRKRERPACQVADGQVHARGHVGDPLPRGVAERVVREVVHEVPVPADFRHRNAPRESRSRTSRPRSSSGASASGGFGASGVERQPGAQQAPNILLTRKGVLSKEGYDHTYAASRHNVGAP